MIIAVSGKGGVGKTMLSSLLIKCMIENDVNNFLVMDADPDSNLPSSLGLCVEKTIGDVREQLMAEQHALPPGYSKDSYFEYKIFEILTETPNFDLLVMGRQEGPECYCMINHILRRVIDTLAKNYSHCIIDSEAGLEHLSRRTTLNVDKMIVVSDLSKNGFETALRIKRLASDLGARFENLSLVVNRVEERYRGLVEERSSEIGFELLGVIPSDQKIEEANFHGRSLLELENSKALDAVKRIYENLRLPIVEVAKHERRD
ncbi:MAG: AAA family ATPase [Candidatus Methanofastidiosia archaeon]